MASHVNTNSKCGANHPPNAWPAFLRVRVWLPVYKEGEVGVGVGVGASSMLTGIQVFRYSAAPLHVKITQSDPPFEIFLHP